MTRKQIEDLCMEGIITEQQREQILARVSAPAAQPPALHLPERGFVFIMCVLAAALIVGGAVVLIVSHWNDVTPLMRSISAMLFMAAVWVGSYLLRHKRPVLSEGLGLLGAGMWGVNILLSHYLYDYNDSPADLFAMFFIGILPIPFLVPQRLLLGVAAVSSFIMLPLMLCCKESPLYLNWVLEHEWYGLVMAVCLGLGIVWWGVGEACRGHSGVYRDYGWVSYPAFLIFLAVLQYVTLYTGMPPLDMGPHGWAALPVVFLIFLLIRPRAVSWGCWGALGAAGCGMVAMAVHLTWLTPTYHSVLGLVSMSLYGAVFLVVGLKSRRQTWINYSALMAALVGFFLVIRICIELMESGLLLVVAGLAVLGFAFLLEGLRRRLVKMVKDKKEQKNTPVSQA
ncbi:MAG: DUF2157 domain-containing protein [Akkermansiaceae bacterium]|nr:DUF2157 domain-containing protein [Akkermansiaceae bacterium]